MTTYRIKPLEWKSGERSARAKTPFGHYEILHSCGVWFISVSPATTSPDDEFKTSDQAKLACQEHWESLMKQALEEV